MGDSAEAHPLLLLLVPVLCLLLLLESPAVTTNQLGLTRRQDEQFALHRAALAPHPAAATRGRPEEGHCPSPLGPDKEPWATPGAVQGATQRREGQSSRSCFKQWDQTGEISSFSGMEKSIRHGGAGQTSPSELKTGRQLPTAVHRSELHHLIRLPGVTPGLERKEISRESTMPVPAHATSSLQGAEPCTSRPGPLAPHKQRPQVSAAPCKGGVAGPEGRICRQGDPQMMLDKQPKLVGS